MKTIETDLGDLIIKKYTRELPFFYTVKGTLSGEDFVYYCGVYKSNFVLETLNVDGFKDIDELEHFRNDDGEDLFEKHYKYSFKAIFGIKVNHFIRACKDFIKDSFKTEDDFIVYSFFGQIKDIKIIKNLSKDEFLCFLIKNKATNEFYKLDILKSNKIAARALYVTNVPQGRCFKLLTSTEDEAIKEFRIGNVVEKKFINLYKNSDKLNYFFR